MGDRLHIAIDTREQQPWSFSDLADTSRATLLAGDYAVQFGHGMVDAGFSVERKALDDYIGTISSGWDRFRRELSRMTEAGFPARVIIVEGTWVDVLLGNYNHPAVSPKFVLRRTSELIYTGCAVVFADSPTAAAGLCWAILMRRREHLERAGNYPDDDTAGLLS